MATFYTIRCLFCASALTESELILCNYCENCCVSSRASVGHYCITCSNIILTKDTRCGQCLSNPPSFERLTCYADYSGPLKWLIKQFKYQRKLYIAPLLNRLLYSEVRKQQDNYPDAIVAMPVHWTRHWIRGFNQSYLIAKLLSDSAKIPLIDKGVKRTKRTPALEGLNRKQRRSVVNKVFSVSVQLPKYVAIVDDVFTTGASAESLARTLKRHGAQRVELWVVARTPRN